MVKVQHYINKNTHKFYKYKLINKKTHILILIWEVDFVKFH